MPAYGIQPTIPNMPEAVAGGIMVAILVAAVYTDLRFGRIPNVLTLAGAAAGLLLSLLFGGAGGLLTGLEGWLLGVALFFAFFALGVMGAGDVKLLAAVGALMGPGFVFNAFIFTGLAGGVIAIIVALRRRMVRYTVASVTAQVQSLAYTGFLPRPKDVKSSPLRFPYGLAIAAGSVAALFVRL